MRAKKRVEILWPAWRYSPDGEGKIFEREEDVPDGWVAKPGDQVEAVELPATVVLDREELVAELTERGIEINPIWGNAHMKRIIDGDISPPW